MKKVFLLIAIAALLLTSFSIISKKSRLQPNTTEKPEAKKTITVSQQIFIFGQKEVLSDTITIAENATALQLLQHVSKTTTQGEGPSAFVTEINGIKADSSRKEYWAFYINGKPAQIGAGSYALQEGDAIAWKIERY